jgi:hypothetical protein
LHRYIDFYLDLIASSDNVSLLYHLAMKAKTVRDGQSHTYSEVRVGVVYGVSGIMIVLLLEPLCYERAHARAYQGPRTSTFLEFAELSGKGKTTFGYSPCTAKSGGGH